jgi:hypothetical protein
MNLQVNSSDPLSGDFQQKYEELDALCCQGIALAESKCRKLETGQVAFSPQIQQAHQTIYAWSLIIKRAKGLQISSRLLQRNMKKAGLDLSSKCNEVKCVEQHLKEDLQALLQYQGLSS